MLEIYADESNTSTYQYMILGGVVINSDSLELIKSRFLGIRAKHGLKREMKWTRVHKSHYAAYHDYVDAFLELLEGNRLHFHAVIIDRHRIDNRLYNDGNKELGFAKFYYQLILKFGRQYGGIENICIYPDQGKLSTRPDTFLRILNAGLAKRWGITRSPFKSVQPLVSGEHDLLQLNDIILGAICHRKNKLYLFPDSRKAKIDLANYLFGKLNIGDLSRDESRIRNHFTIWNFVFPDK